MELYSDFWWESCYRKLGILMAEVINVLYFQEVNGWYYLLSEDVGPRKHLQATGRRPLVKPKSSGQCVA